jgi:hypothetical protein
MYSCMPVHAHTMKLHEFIKSYGQGLGGIKEAVVCTSDKTFYRYVTDNKWQDDFKNTLRSSPACSIVLRQTWMNQVYLFAFIKMGANIHRLSQEENLYGQTTCVLTGRFLGYEANAIYM